MAEPYKFKNKSLVEEDAPPDTPPTLQERAQKVLGLDPTMQRSAVLPFRPAGAGETTLGQGALEVMTGQRDLSNLRPRLEFQVPQVGADMAESSLLVGHAARGGDYTIGDVTRAGLDYGMLGVPTAAPKMTRKQFRSDAPSTEDLKAAAVSAKNKAGHLVVKGDHYDDLISKIGKDMEKQMHPGLHPKAAAALEAVSKLSGDNVSLEDLQIARRLIGVAARSVEDDEVRLAVKMKDHLDDFIENLTPDKLSSGSALGTAANLRKFRLLWSRAKKSEEIEDMLRRARLQASGFENGIVIEFRSLLNNPKRSRGFSQSEIEAMEELVKRPTTTKIKRLIGRLSMGTMGGSNFLGGSIGIATGAHLGGPAGAVVAPAIGHAGASAAGRATHGAAQDVRAMAATGRPMPKRNIPHPPARNIVGPTFGTLLEDEDELKKFLRAGGA